MLLVVADTSPIRYLVEIGHIGLLPQLFERIFIPSLVYDELRHPSAPAAVRAWTNSLPAWLEVLPVTMSDDPAFQALDDGEKSALTLGMTLGADLILIDDRKGAAVALQKDSRSPEPWSSYALGAARHPRPCRCAGAPEAHEFPLRQELFDDLLKKYAESGNG